MKFLCPNCKAKYQIADEKVAGRTLKMDCRRCGHSIVLKGDQLADDAVADAPASSPAARPAPSNPAASNPAASNPAASNPAASNPATPRPAPAASGRSGSGLLQPGAARRTTTTTGRGGSHVGPAPSRPAAAPPRSALGADFRRSVGSTGSLAPESPRTTPLDQWHVAINDVPVGPMRRDEISRKIATGAVTAESLAWREGFDDWRPLRDIPELAALLRKSEALRPGAIPPKTAMPGAPRPGAPVARPATGATASRPGPARPASTPGMAAAARATGTPAGRGNVVAIGGRLGASAAPALDDDGLDELESEPTRVASALDLPAEIAAPAPSARPKSAPPPAPALDEADELPDPFPSAPAAAPQPASSSFAAAPAAPVSPASSSPALKSAPAVVSVPEPARERERRGLPVGAWIAIAGAMSFGIAMAVMIAPRLMPAAPAAPAATATTSPAAAVPQEAPREAPVEVPEAPTPPEATATPTPEQPTPEQPAQTARTGTQSTRRPTTPATTTTTTTGAGAQAATKSTDTSGAFARFADEGSSTGPAPIAPRPQTSGGTGGSAGSGSGDGLEPAQVRAVVAREQRGLQSCWELAIRGMREVPTTRMDVDITIGESGTVTRATARGVGVGNLGECIERNVRRWRFPSSGGTTQMSFPVVFQGA